MLYRPLLFVFGFAIVLGLTVPSCSERGTDTFLPWRASAEAPIP